jgi:hypothetical protein
VSFLQCLPTLEATVPVNPRLLLGNVTGPMDVLVRHLVSVRVCECVVVSHIFTPQLWTALTVVSAQRKECLRACHDDMVEMVSVFDTEPEVVDQLQAIVEKERKHRMERLFLIRDGATLEAVCGPLDLNSGHRLLTGCVGVEDESVPPLPHNPGIITHPSMTTPPGRSASASAPSIKEPFSPPVPVRRVTDTGGDG